MDDSESWYAILSDGTVVPWRDRAPAVLAVMDDEGIRTLHASLSTLLATMAPEEEESYVNYGGTTDD